MVLLTFITKLRLEKLTGIFQSCHHWGNDMIAIEVSQNDMVKNKPLPNHNKLRSLWLFLCMYCVVLAVVLEAMSMSCFSMFDNRLLNPPNVCFLFDIFYFKTDAHPHPNPIYIYIYHFFYTLSGACWVVKIDIHGCYSTSEDRFCANLRAQEQSTNMTSQC